MESSPKPAQQSGLEESRESPASSSTTSTSSSFVPVDQHLENAIQIVNENKEFNDNILQYIERASNGNHIGNNYHIVSVFGSQSTGKSTLLNKLFNTNFDVMEETKRQQTTKGIWMAYSPLVSTPVTSNAGKLNEHIFVMDVEGTDGRERGEDQDFERKAALFALSTSEILIVNIWETQVGLYQGANMGLLKTVFEVNLSLFGKSKLEKNDHKVLLLFVIRDHLGVTPLENLAATLTQDMIKMWDGLNLSPELSHLQFQDFFDISFHALGHKVLQPEKFIEGVQDLGKKLVNVSDAEYLFKTNYHHNIPVDGWTMYAQNCWDQIDKNKDLDLPTQQILVAKFRCDEISNTVFEEFEAKFHELLLSKAPVQGNDAISDINYEELGFLLLDLRADTLENYDLSASRYNTSVYNQRRTALLGKIHAKYHELAQIYSDDLSQKISKKFIPNFTQYKKTLPGETYYERIKNLQGQTLDEFTQKLGFLSLNGGLLFDKHTEKLKADLDQLVSKQQVFELNSIVNKHLKKFHTGMTKVIAKELGDPKEETWQNIITSFRAHINEVLSKYKTEDGGYDFQVGTSKELNDNIVEKLLFKSWTSLSEVIRKYVSKDNVLTILKDRFDDKFRYDENGLPKLYQDAAELEISFDEAKSFALKVLPLLTIAKLPDGSEIIPDYDIFDRKLQRKFGGAPSHSPEEHNVEFNDDSEDEDSDEDLAPKFSDLITEEAKAEILRKFKKDIDARFVETKRSIVQHVTQIPYYIYLVILVLGWNEFMAILRNPFFFSLLIVAGAGFYILYQMNLLKPASLVVQRMIDESLVIAKQKLKEFVIDEHELHHQNLSKMAATTNPRESKSLSIELDDLDPKTASDI